jgi:titin
MSDALVLVAERSLSMSLFSRRTLCPRPSRPTYRPQLETLECRLSPAVFTVTNVADSGAGSLRQTILKANVTAGLNTIKFTIGTGLQVIAPASPLPAITNPVVIDGTTQPGFSGTPLIDIDGLFAGTSANGLVISAGGSTIKGLVVNAFAASGIVLSVKGGDTIRGNFIGTNTGGTLSVANGDAGVHIINVGSNQITGNLIAGNTGFGILITGAGAAHNVIQGNNIGITIGDSALPNGYGVFIGGGAKSNKVGGARAAARNVISGNSVHGVEIAGVGTSGNLIQGDYLGVNQAGTAAVANGLDGVVIQDGATNNIVAGDLLSGNGLFAALLSGAGTTGNVIKTSLVGTTADGKSGLANGSGILLTDGASTNTITGNVLGANTNEIEIGGPATMHNVIQANLLGTNRAGTATLPTVNGVVIFGGASNNLIGGAPRALGNLISTGNGQGLNLKDVGTSGNIVENNLIGTNPAGNAALGNLTGIFVSNGPSANVFTLNVISGNGLGVGLFFPATTANVVTGNLVGTNAAGNAALPNNDGMQIGGIGNIVGGTTAAARNVISGNTRYGVLIDGTSDLVEGNFIGTQKDGVHPLGNGASGVFVTGGGANNSIGGTRAGAGNVIANNGADGVLIGSDPNAGFNTPAGTRNAVLHNSIFANVQLGIDLGAHDGLTQNDAAGHNGPNNFQNFPVPTEAFVSGSFLVIVGTLSSAPTSSTFRLEIFANASADPSGHGEGKTFLGFTTVFINFGTTGFVAVLPDPLASGQFISATATDPSNNTSEFSADIQVR